MFTASNEALGKNICIRTSYISLFKYIIIHNHFQEECILRFRFLAENLKKQKEKRKEENVVKTEEDLKECSN